MTFNKLLFWGCLAAIATAIIYTLIVEPIIDGVKEFNEDVQAYQAERLYPFDE